MTSEDKRGCGICEFFCFDRTDGEPTCNNIHSEFYGWKSREGFPLMAVCRHYQPAETQQLRDVESR
jgi:hypothetical protein